MYRDWKVLGETYCNRDEFDKKTNGSTHREQSYEDDITDVILCCQNESDVLVDENSNDDFLSLKIISRDTILFLCTHCSYLLICSFLFLFYTRDDEKIILIRFTKQPLT